MLTAVITFQDESGETRKGELVSPFRVEDGILLVLGREGDPLVLTVVTSEGDDDICFHQVEMHRVTAAQPLMLG